MKFLKMNFLKWLESTTLFVNSSRHRDVRTIFMWIKKFSLISRQIQTFVLPDEYRRRNAFRAGTSFLPIHGLNIDNKTGSSSRVESKLDQ